MNHFLDFEKPIAALEGKIKELRHLGGDSGMNIAEEIGKLQSRIDKELAQTYKKLGPWEKVQVARHPERPKMVQIIEKIFDEFIALSGDRAYAEDYAIIGGMARFRGRPVIVMGTEKAVRPNSALNAISVWCARKAIARLFGWICQSV